MKRFTKLSTFIFIAVILGLLLLAVSWQNYSVSYDSEDVVIIEPEELEIKEVEVNDMWKANDFILAKLPFENVNLERIYGQEEEYNLTENDMKNSTLQTFYSAIKTGDIDYLTSVTTAPTYQKIWGSETDIENREKLLLKFLDEMDRAGKLEKIMYRLKQGSFDAVSNEGVMTLHYTDLYTLEIPFTFIEIGENTEVFYQIEF